MSSSENVKMNAFTPPINTNSFCNRSFLSSCSTRRPLNHINLANQKQIRSRVIAASTLQGSSSTLSEQLNEDLQNRDYRTALHRLEEAVTNQINPLEPVTSYKYFHELVTVGNQTRKWELALRAFRILEKTGYTSSRSTSTLVLSVLCRAGRISEARHIIETLWEQDILQCDGTRRDLTSIELFRRTPDEKMVTQTANAAVHNGRPEVAITLLREMESKNLPPTVFSISVQIKAYGRQERPEAILNLLSSFNRLDIVPDIVVFNTAIDAFIRCGDLPSAMQVFKEIEHRELEANSRSYNPIIKYLAAHRKLDQAFALQKSMEKNGIPSSQYTLNALLYGCTKMERWDLAKDLLLQSHDINNSDTMDGSQKGDKISKDLIVGYTTVISGLANKENIPAALSLLEGLAQKIETAPKSKELDHELGIAVTAILTVFLKKGDVARGWTLLRSVQRRFSISLPPDTYTAIIRGLTRRNDTVSMDAAVRAFEQMLKIFGKKNGKGKVNRRYKDYNEYEATEHDFALAYNSMIDGFVRRGSTTSAEQLLDEMEDSGHVPTVVTYTTLINGYGKEMDMISARRVFKRMRNAGLTPDRVTMNAFLGACVRNGDMMLATKIFDHMQHIGNYLSPNLITFSAMIAGLVREQKKSEAWDMYEEMKGVGITPNERLLERMMAVFVSPDLKPKKAEIWSIDDDDMMSEMKEQVEEIGKKDGNTQVEEEQDDDDNDDGNMMVITKIEDDEEIVEGIKDDENEIDDELREQLVNSVGWDSERALTLLEDMSHCKVSEMNRRRWKEAMRTLYIT